MSSIKTATRSEWLLARRQLLEQEKALTRQKDELSKARRALPWVKLDQDYVFDTANGAATLSSLFGECSQLVVYHFMYGPAWGDAGCVSCSFWADTFNGLEPHLNARDIAFVAVSRAPMEKIAPFKKRMAWDFNWVSSFGNDFNVDFNVAAPDPAVEGQAAVYNFREIERFPVDEMHGTSVFVKDEHGAIFHTYSTYGRGLDVSNAAYSYMDMTPKGRDEASEGNTMAWVRHHDNY